MGRELPLCPGAEQTLNSSRQDKIPRLFSSPDSWLRVLKLVPHLPLCFHNEFPDLYSRASEQNNFLPPYTQQKAGALAGARIITRRGKPLKKPSPSASQHRTAHIIQVIEGQLNHRGKMGESNPWNCRPQGPLPCCGWNKWYQSSCPCLPS